MKKIILSLIFLFIAVQLFAQTGVDPRYHTYPEIIAELDSLQDEYPQLLHTEIIGYTNGADFYQDPLPVWAAKISDNPEVDEDEPAVLYVGQCHAEEILGVEVTMYMLKEILDNFYLTPYSVWISNLEIWFVPTMNPEGLQVVMDGWDTSFRKNKRDNNLNQVFDFSPEIGYDADGVDLNRNYSFNWVHGDTLWDPSHNELWDYYRGPGPFSEGGNRAVRDLADEQHFIFSINWHSSRSGNFSEKVFYPFEWDGMKSCPDFFVTKTIGEEVASRIEKEPPQTGNYEPSPSRGRKGNAQDWFYQMHSTIQLLIECGTSNLQPGGAQAWLIDDTCERCKVGAYWLLSRALGYQEDAAMLTGHITDSQTGNPIEAEIIIEDFQAPYFSQRLSEPTYGRFWRVLQQGTYDIKICKKGYEEQVIQNVTINNSAWTNLEVQLNPLGICQFEGTASAGGEPVSGEIIITDIVNDTISFSNGSFNFEIYEGEHTMIALSDGFIPQIDSINLSPGIYDIDIIFQPEEIIFSEDWENGLGGWNVEGTWTTVLNGFENTSSLSTNSSQFYCLDTVLTITTSNPINLNGVADDIILTFWTKYHTEYVNDVCSVEISTDGSNWINLKQFSGYVINWKQVFVPLPDYVDTQIYLRFKLTSDETLVDPGWLIDGIKITSSVGNSVDIPETEKRIILKQNFPNPFYESTTISFITHRGDAKNAEINIYNIKGQLIKTIKPENTNRPDDEPFINATWDGKDNQGNPLASGIYFYKLDNGKSESAKIKKCVLIK